MGNEVQDVLEVQRVEGILRRAIEVVSHPVWEQEWDGMFRREELIEELEELARRPRDLLAAKNEGGAARALAKKRQDQLDKMGRDLREKELSLEVARAEIARLKGSKAGRSEARPLQEGHHDARD